MKNRNLVISLILLCGILSATGAPAEDVIFKAMGDELDRSMDRLVIEDMQPPYFMSYTIQDDETVGIKARYGALVKSEADENRYLSIEIRVGDPSLDNSNYIGSWRDLSNQRENLIEEVNYNSLRHQLWLHTDKAYKSAAENLARKTAYLQTHPSMADIPDFTDAESFVCMEEPVDLKTDMKALEAGVRNAADVLGGFPALHDWMVNYFVRGKTKRYLNSENNKCLTGMVNHLLQITATTQAKDGQKLTAFLSYVSRDDQNPLLDEKLADNIRKMAEELTAVVAAEPLEEYAGPVMFADYASAQLISQLFVNQLTFERKVLTAEEWMSRYLPMGKLVNRVNRRVFPDFVTVTDEPNRKSLHGQLLTGYRVVDDEGVKSRNITLVKAGRLVDIPLSRRPTKKLSGSNGHALLLQNQWIVPAVTNLFVGSDKPKSTKKLMGELRTLCRDFGNEYGLLIKLLEDPRISRTYMWMEPSQEDEPILTPPVIMYKVYEKDGRVEPVRGLVFDEVSIRNLRDIIAMGKEEHVYNILQDTPFQGYGYAAAIVTPAILVEEMELKMALTREPLPISQNPIFDK